MRDGCRLPLPLPKHRAPGAASTASTASPLTAALWMLADRAVSLLLGVVMTWHLTRYLGVEGYGYYTLAATIVTAFALIADLAGGQVVVREAAARPERAERVVGTALVLRGLLGVTAMVICCLTTVGYPAPVRTAILFLSVTLLLAPCEALNALLQARLQLRLLSFIGMAATTLNLLLLLVAIAHDAGLALVTAATAAPVAFRAVATAFLFRRCAPELGASRAGGRGGIPIPLGADLAVAQRLFLASWPLAVGALLSQVPGGLPTLCLSHQHGDQLGTFAAASRIPAMLSILPTTVMIALFPLMSRAWAMRNATVASRATVAAVLDRAYAALLALALPITISCVVLAPEAIRILYGGQFAGSVTGLRVIALSLMVMYPGIAAGNMLIAMGRERLGMLITAGGAALSALLTPPAASAFGATGAATAQAFVYTAMGIASLIAVRAVHRPPRAAHRPCPAPSAVSLVSGSWYHRIIGCALVMTGVVLLLRRVDAFAAFALGLTTYLLCLWLTGLIPIILRLPTLEALDRGGHAPLADQPTLLFRLARRVERQVTDLFWRCVGCITHYALRSTQHAIQGTPRTILVIDTDYIGDAILATPVLAALKRRFPEARLTLGAAPGVAPLLASHPAVDRVVALDTRPGLQRALRLYRDLRRLEKPQDLAIGLSAVPANAWIGHVAGALVRAPRRIGEAHGRFVELLTDAVSRDPGLHHWTSVYHAVLRPLGIDAPPEPPRLATGEDARTGVDRFLAEQGALPRPWIGIHPGGRIYQVPEPSAPGGVALLSRRWPQERFTALVERLLADGGTLFLTGSTDDAPVTSAIKACCAPVLREKSRVLRKDGGSSHAERLADTVTQNAEHGTQHALIDTTGRLSLPETAALIERMDAYVTNDTGPMHLALALDVPTVALFGPTDPRRAGPLPGDGRHQVLAPDLPCSPCGGEALVPCRNPAGQECLTAIPVEAVYQAAKAALGCCVLCSACCVRTGRLNAARSTQHGSAAST
jgi:heptosyltransferase-2